MQIEITQFLLPDGRQRRCTLVIPDELGGQYERIKRSGVRLTAEVLTTGEVSLCLEDPGVGDDFDIRVVENGPAVPQAWEDMIRQFDTAAYKAWHNDMQDDAANIGGHQC